MHNRYTVKYRAGQREAVKTTEHYTTKPMTKQLHDRAKRFGCRVVELHDTLKPQAASKWFDTGKHWSTSTILTGEHAPTPAKIMANIATPKRTRATKQPIQVFSPGATKECPKCEHEGSIDEDFGWRQMGAKIVPQSQCRKCRSSAGTKSRLKTPVAPAPDRIQISDDRAQVLELFKQHCPADKTPSRSWRFMVVRLVNKLGDKCELTPAAKAK